MTEKKRRPPKKRSAVSKSPYFLQPGKQGAVTVFRRPAGNRIDAKLCGTMANRAMAMALMRPDLGLLLASVGCGPIMVQFVESVVIAKTWFGDIGPRAACRRARTAASLRWI